MNCAVLRHYLFGADSFRRRRAQRGQLRRLARPIPRALSEVRPFGAPLGLRPETPTGFATLHHTMIENVSTYWASPILYTIFLPMAAVVALLFMCDASHRAIHQVAFYTSLVNFVLSLLL
jgi:hypothetical protein